MSLTQETKHVPVPVPVRATAVYPIFYTGVCALVYAVIAVATSAYPDEILYFTDPWASLAAIASAMCVLLLLVRRPWVAWVAGSLCGTVAVARGSALFFKAVEDDTLASSVTASYVVAACLWWMFAISITYSWLFSVVRWTVDHTLWYSEQKEGPVSEEDD
jgi:hypothetical protein